MVAVLASTPVRSNCLKLSSATSGLLPGLINSPFTSICLTSFSFLVIVPVLSQAPTPAPPRASTAAIFRTTAFPRAFSATPRARVTDNPVGKPSGITATARLTPPDQAVSQPPPLHTTKPTIIVQAAAPNTTISLANLSSLMVRGESSFFTPDSSCANCPNLVAPPVAVTSIHPYPLATKVPEKTSDAFSWSACLETGIDSPVNTASFTSSSTAFTILPSAGTRKPSSRYTISPGTIAPASISVSVPDLFTLTLPPPIFLSFFTASSALYSCTQPKIALTSTMATISAASTVSPTTSATTAAAPSSTTSGLLN